MSGEGSCKWHAGTPMSFIVVVKFKRLKIRVFGPGSLQHGTRKVFEFPNYRSKIRASMDKRCNFPPLLHEYEEGNSPIVTTNGSRK